MTILDSIIFKRSTVTSESERAFQLTLETQVECTPAKAVSQRPQSEAVALKGLSRSLFFFPQEKRKERLCSKLVARERRQGSCVS
jgi:hypothetical protein